MISRDRQSARSAVMPALPQAFRDGRTAGAFLRRAWGVDLDSHSRSLYRFREENDQEHPPADIMHRFGQHAAGESFDVEVFNGNQPVAIHQHASGFVMKIPALVGDMRMRLLQELYGLASPMTATLPACHPALGTSQLGLCRAKVPRILDARPVRERSERLQAHIDAHGFKALRQGRGLTLNAEADVPASSFALQGHGLDRALQRAVPLHLQFAYALTVQLAVLPDPATIPVAGEGVTVEAGARLEPGIAGLFPGFHPTKEGIERLLDAPQHLLAGGEIRQAE